MKLKSSTKTLIKIFVLITLSVIAFYIVFRKDFSNIVKIIQTANPGYIILCIALMLFVFLIDGYILACIAKIFKPKYTIAKGFINNQYNIFFSGITPLATGGEPFQIYAFKKQHMKVEHGIGIIFIHFLLYKATLLSIALVSLLTNYTKIVRLFSGLEIYGHTFNFLFIIIIAFVIIAGLSTLLIAAAYSKYLVSFVTKIIYFLAKIKIIKNPDKIIDSLNGKVIIVRENIKQILKNKSRLIYLFIVMLIRFLIFYSIPYITFYALNINIGFKYYLDTISLASYTNLISGIIPSPGGSVGVELAYVYLFNGYFKAKLSLPNIDDIIKSSLLIWRTITFYFGLILSSILVLIHTSKKHSSLD